MSCSSLFPCLLRHTPALVLPPCHNLPILRPLALVARPGLLASPLSKRNTIVVTLASFLHASWWMTVQLTGSSVLQTQTTTRPHRFWIHLEYRCLTDRKPIFLPAPATLLLPLPANPTHNSLPERNRATGQASHSSSLALLPPPETNQIQNRCHLNPWEASAACRSPCA